MRMRAKTGMLVAL